MLRIFARATTGKSHALEVAHDTTIENLKAEVAQCLGLEESLFDIEWEGRLLARGEHLSALGVAAEDDVHVVPSEKAQALEALEQMGIPLTVDAMQADLVLTLSGTSPEECAGRPFTLLCKAGVKPSMPILSYVCSTGCPSLLDTFCAHVPPSFRAPPYIIVNALGTNVEFVDCLLRHALLEDGEGEDTLLHLAMSVPATAPDIVQRLLQTYDPNVPERTGHTPLHLAAMAYSLPMVRLLMKHPNADPQKAAQDGTTPLHFAAMGTAGAPVMELLLESGASVSATDDKAWTPLHLAAKRDAVECIKVLISNKADGAAKDRNGETPLHMAAQHGYHTVIDLLVASGVDVNVVDNQGKTPMHHAAGRLHGATVEYLMQTHKADPSILDVTGKTAEQCIPKTRLVGRGR